MKLKKFASIGALIALLVSAAFIAGCKQDANSGGGSGGLSGGGGNGDNVANPFIGTWEGSRDSFFYKLVFDATTVSAYYKTSASESWQSEGSSSYTFSGNRATPQGTGGTPHTFTVSGNVLTVSDGRILHKK
ncbi:MAG: hypothetical protein ACTTKX_05535 [Treponema sp.]